ncbi:MAG: cytochrome-c peroxidase [Chitinophagaceae bacterium]
MMLRSLLIILLGATGVLWITGCAKADVQPASYPALERVFGNRLGLNAPTVYSDQAIPNYITKDVARQRPLDGKRAILGRVLFYDKQLSIDNTISCGSCHQQPFAFGDTALVSDGVAGGLTLRHAMRLVNNRFANEQHFFWNERATSLEAQTTLPIREHGEMGFSGLNGRPGFAELLKILAEVDYYQELFRFVYGDAAITESRLQECLANFVRSIQSFDAKYDAGRSLVNQEEAPFPNFSAQENLGKSLWINRPQFDANGVRIAGGLGCNGCHNAPEFDIDPNSGNNGVIGIINASGVDIGNTKAPSLRDLINDRGDVNGPLMHTGNFSTLKSVIGHYGTINITRVNTQLDPRLRPNGLGQQLQVKSEEVDAVVAFLKTLTGKAIYHDPKWSDPF